MAAESARVATLCNEAKETNELNLYDCNLMSIPLAIFTVLSGVPLRSADFSKNQITKVNPKIRSFGTLEVLNFSQNRLTTLPNDISFLLQLRYLDLSSNLLTAIPEAVFELKALEVLDASDNQISELDPKPFSKLRFLNELKFEGNPVDSSLVTAIAVQLQIPSQHRRF